MKLIRLPDEMIDYGLLHELVHTQIKNQLTNIALESTSNGDVASGLLLWTGEAFRRFVLKKRGETKKRKTIHSTVI